MNTLLLNPCACPSKATTGQAPPVVLASGASLAEFRASARDIALQPGQYGRIVATGPGLGFLANLAGQEAVWERALKGVVHVEDVHGEGMDRAVVKWRIPDVAQTAQARMSIGPAVLVLAALIVALFVALGWAITRLDLLLDSPVGRAVALGGLAVVLLIGVVLLVGARR